VLRDQNVVRFAVSLWLCGE